MTTLRECPAGHDTKDHERPIIRDVAVESYAMAVTCERADCNLQGPTDDPDGSKWNAIPRHSDVAAAFREGFQTGASIPTVGSAAASTRLADRLAELYGGALPKYFTVADVVAAMREALEICRERAAMGDWFGSPFINWEGAEAAINARIAELSK